MFAKMKRRGSVLKQKTLLIKDRVQSKQGASTRPLTQLIAGETETQHIVPEWCRREHKALQVCGEYVAGELADVRSVPSQALVIVESAADMETTTAVEYQRQRDESLELLRDMLARTKQTDELVRQVAAAQATDKKTVKQAAAVHKDAAKSSKSSGRRGSADVQAAMAAAEAAIDERVEATRDDVLAASQSLEEDTEAAETYHRARFREAMLTKLQSQLDFHRAALAAAERQLRAVEAMK